MSDFHLGMIDLVQHGQGPRIILVQQTIGITDNIAVHQWVHSYTIDLYMHYSMYCRPRC